MDIYFLVILETGEYENGNRYGLDYFDSRVAALNFIRACEMEDIERISRKEKYVIETVFGAENLPPVMARE